MTARASGGPGPVTSSAASEMTALLVAEVEDYAILMLDAAGNVATWNAGARRIKGYGADEIIGRHFSAFYPPEDSELPAQLLSAAARDGRVASEGWRVRKDGSRFWASVVITALRDEDGEVRGYGKVTRDLTERHEAETELREAEARFRLAFTHAPIGMSITGLSGAERGRYLEVNPALARMLGYEPAELQGMRVSEVTPAAEHESVRETLAQLSTGRSVSFEKSFLHRHGHEIVTLLSATPLPEPRSSEPRRAITQMLDISERKRFEAQLRHLADHDALTGLYNRHRFESELERVTSEVQRYRRSAALLVLDLDGFKYVNDRFGHPVGDELVSRIGALLADTVRDSDIVARLGGDEFAVILPEAVESDAVRLAERILDAIRHRGVIAHELRHARVTASIGVTAFDASTLLAGSDLVVEADIAMYDAKGMGRDCLVAYDRESRRRQIVSKRHSWLDRLRAALDEDRFVLHAQPIHGICADGVPGFELLLRLADEEGELIPPGAFLYNAERFGLMGAIDRWVLRRAVMLLHAHHQAGHDLSVSVNLSGKTMNDSELPAELAALLSEHPISPDRLVIEVTETAAIVNIDRARSLATELRRLGCKFALDDFGAGFASFYYLKHLEFDYLKIDGEFIRNLTNTPTDQLVVRAVVEIARGLQTETVAEFVGDDETVALLQRLGVDYGQGFHLGVPGPLDEVLPALSDGA